MALSVQLTLCYSRQRTANVVHNGGRDVLPLVEYQTKRRFITNADQEFIVYGLTGEGSGGCMTCTKDAASGGRISYIGDAETSDEAQGALQMASGHYLITLGWHSLITRLEELRM